MTDEPSDHTTPKLTLAEAAAEVAEIEAAVESLFAQYPAEEHREVAAKMYFDADGNPRTRHGQLRGL